MPEKATSGRGGSETRGTDKGEAFGMAAVMQIFKGTQFPVKKDDLVRKAGNNRISWTKNGDKLELADLVRRAPASEFPSMAQVISAVSTAAKGGGGKGG